MKYEVRGPDGEVHTLETESEGALFDAIEQLWKGDDPEPEPEPEREAPLDLTPIAEGVGAHLADHARTIVREAAGHAQEIIKAIERNKVEIPPPAPPPMAPDNSDLIAAVEDNGRRIAALADQLARIEALIAAPRELERDRNGRAQRSIVVL